jgi:hypothetical protein
MELTMKYLFVVLLSLTFFGCAPKFATAKNTIGGDITVINPYTDEMCVKLLNKRANLKVTSYVLTGLSLSPAITTPLLDSKGGKIGVAAGAATAALISGGLAIKINMLSDEIERHCDVVPAPSELPWGAPMEIEL